MIADADHNRNQFKILYSLSDSVDFLSESIAKESGRKSQIENKKMVQIEQNTHKA